LVEPGFFKFSNSNTARIPAIDRIRCIEARSECIKAKTASEREKMDFTLSEQQEQICSAMEKLCAPFDDEY
jgi:hypothetical protein